MAAVLVCGSALAACSGHASHSAPTPARPAPAPPATPQQAAHTVDQTMLDAVQLPRGAQPFRGPLPAILASATSVPALANQVDEHRAWSVPLPVKSLGNFDFTPVRNGFDGAGTASGGRMSTNDGTAWLAGSTYSKLPLNVAFAQLNIAVTDDGQMGSVIRADGLAYWTPPKIKTELVPPDDHVAVITVMAADSPPRLIRRVVVTDPKQFGVMAASIDRLRLAPIVLGGEECGLLNVEVPGLGWYGRGAIIMQVEYSRDLKSKPNLLVWTPTCHGIGVRANGKSQPALSGDFRTTVRGVMLAAS